MLTPDHPTADRGPAVPGPNSFARAIDAGTTLFESQIWSFDGGKSLILYPSWVNADGKNASRSDLTYVPSSGGFAIVGDRSAFEERYGAAYPAVSCFALVKDGMEVDLLRRRSRSSPRRR